MFDLENRITEWKDHLRRKGPLNDRDLEELESHLREEIDSLSRSDLTEEESFLVALKRIGRADALSREYAKVASDEMWRQLVIEEDDPQGRRQALVRIGWAVLLAGLSGLTALVPTFFGYTLLGDNALAYARHIGFFFIPGAAVYLTLAKKTGWHVLGWVMVPAVVSLVFIDLAPFSGESQTEKLVVLHLPIMLWLLTGAVYEKGRPDRQNGRMNFVRFSGEAFIYTTLIYCGGVVLSAVILVVFESIDLNVQNLLWNHVAAAGLFGAPVVAVYLADAKKSVVENLAPVLARIFSPLFILTMIAFLIVMIALGKSPFMNREFLIGFDVLLIIVLGIVLYIVSARPSEAPAGLFDYLNLALIVLALIVDGVALSAIIFRLSSFGLTPNKIAALGENVILLANLGGLALLYVLLFLKKISFRRLAGWQTGYLPVYAVWMAIVVFGFPLIFGYV